MARFVPSPGLDIKIADRIGRPVVSRVLDMLQDEARRAAPSTKVWVTARDERVRRSHIETDSQVVPANLRFKVPKVATGDDVNDIRVGFDLARYPRDPALPIGNRINCFPGSTLAQPLGELRAILRAPYAAAMTTVRTESGRVLTGTPNHPVLTPDGLVPLGALDVGDHLVYSGFIQAPAGRLHPEARGQYAAVLSAWEAPHVDRGPATLAEMFLAAERTFGTHRMVGGSVDLYGDALDGDVEVVAVDRVLQEWLESAGAQRVGHLDLTAPQVHEVPRPSSGVVLPLGVAGARAATRHIGRERKPLALIGGRGSHAGEHRIGAPPPLHTGAFQARLDGPPGDAEGARKRELGLPGAVAADQIVDVEVDPVGWRGHVYSLSTSRGHFIADGFVVGNCRCQAPELPELLRESIHRGDVTVDGTHVHGDVSTRFPRAAESEFGTSGDDGAYYMTNALREVAARLRASHTR